VLARSPSNAKRLTVQVDVPKIRRRRVCIRIYGSNFGFIGRFPRKVWTRQDTIKSPRLRAHYATGKLKKKGCKRIMT
jgi:hypothetical protein